MQENYKKLAKPRNLLTGGLGASSRDLSTLFVVRAVELYLRSGGKFAFVLPHGILTRKPHTGFRSGAWMTKNSDPLAATFDVSWDLADTTTGFPMVSCVVFGQRTATATAMSTHTRKWVGKLTRADIPWLSAKAKLSCEPGVVAVLDADAASPESPYKRRFRQGAVLVPRMTMFVVDGPSGPLGAGAGRASVQSQRTNQDKPPWKDAPTISAKVETEFIHPVYLGETIVPFSTMVPRRVVSPIKTMQTILTSNAIAEYPGLDSWWEQAEQIWAANKSSADQSSLLDRIDYLGQLSAQLPTASLRVVYTKAGNTLAAAIVTDREALIDHKLYWAPADSLEEAHYISAILNSRTLLERVRPLQALGLFKGRDWDKNVFAVPFERYDHTNSLHAQVSEFGAAAQVVAAATDVTTAKTFQAARRLVRSALDSSGLATQIETSVSELLSVHGS